MTDQKWCLCGHSYGLHAILNSERGTSKWWWICSSCHSFEEVTEDELKKAMNGRGLNMSGIKRTVADKWFSDCVRARDRHTCQRCGKQYPEKSAGLHCAHIVGRRNAATRYDLLNAVALCYPCHRWVDGEIIEAYQWLQDKYGQDRLDYLTEQKRVVVRHNEAMRKAVAKHYRDECGRMADDQAYMPFSFNLQEWQK